MKKKFSLIIPYRDREISRVKMCLESLLDLDFASYEIIFVDYGSKISLRQDIFQYLEKLDNVQYIFNNTTGLLWNRAHALNTGIKKAQSEFVVMVDVDLIFPRDFLQVVTSLIEKNGRQAYHYRCIYLDEGQYQAPNSLKGYQLSNKTGLGLAIYPLKELQDIEGYNEYFQLWGYEDIELNQRLTSKYNMPTYWFDEDEVISYHIWHPHIKSQLPAGWNTQYQESKQNLRKMGTYGYIFASADRPVLKKESPSTSIHFTAPFEKSIANFILDFARLSSGQTLEICISENLKKGKAVRLVEMLNKAIEKIGLGYKLGDLDLVDGRRLTYNALRGIAIYTISNLSDSEFDYDIKEFSEEKFRVWIMKK